MIIGRAIPLAKPTAVSLLGVRPTDGRPSDHAARMAGPWWASLASALLAIAVSGGAVWLRAYVEERVATAPPAVRGIDVYRMIVNDTPVRVAVTAGWQKVTEWTTHEAVRSDPTLWRRMHVEDWDRVPSPLRERALESMLTRYRHVLVSPSTWDRMGAADWDSVPQPVRALAYRHMAEYWTGYYQVGAAHAIPRGLMADTVAAIIMAESWFEHRAENVNAWGNRDLGVAQASDSARARMTDMYAQGRADFRLADADYFNPWNGTRFTAFWMAMLLDELDGDLDAAIRAYHRGTVRALAGLGAAYQVVVEDRRRRYIRNAGGSAAWAYLWTRDRQMRAEDWPWMAIARRSVRVPITEQSMIALTAGMALAR